MISDGLEAKAGSLSAGYSRFMAWKTVDPVGAHCMRPDGIHPDNQGTCNARPTDHGIGIDKAKAKWTKMEALIGSRQRIKNLAKDIVSHFEARQEVFAGKGMLVSMSRRIAAELYQEITQLKPEWHSDDLNKGVIKVVMTAASSDGPELAKHHTTKQQRKQLAERMKDDGLSACNAQAGDELKLVIVRDMWLTGFDAHAVHCQTDERPQLDASNCTGQSGLQR